MSVPLQGSFLNTFCPECNREISMEAFPALLKRADNGIAGERLIVDDQSSCFYHQDKKAVVHCEACGRFLCSMCQIGFEGRNMCPTCIESGMKKGKFERIKNETIRYDDIALSLSILPVLLIIPIYFTFITAPLSIFFAILSWRRPLSVVQSYRWRSVVAILASSAQLVAWVFVLAAIFSSAF